MKPMIRSLLFTLFALPTLALAEIPAGLESRLAELFNTQPDSITPMPLEGIYEVSLAGQILYITGDAEYLFDGEMYSLVDRVNLTEQSRNQARMGFIDELAADELISYPANGQEKHVITVFTDIDCGYCRRLHRGMEEMNDLGITVRYMAFPRSPAGSASFNKSVSVWCADDREAAMTAAKIDNRVSPKSCDNDPVGKHQQIGQQIGVRGTPAILLSNGTLIPGYMEPNKLLEAIEERL